MLGESQKVTESRSKSVAPSAKNSHLTERDVSPRPQPKQSQVLSGRIDNGVKVNNLVKAENLPPIDDTPKTVNEVKSEQITPNEKVPISEKSFDFNSCVKLLTSDSVLEHLKRGKSWEPIFTKANIPNDRARARVIKKLFHMVCSAYCLL